MIEIDKAQRLIDLMIENYYLPKSSKVDYVELDENEDINIVFTYYDCEDYENVLVPREIWDLNSDAVFESWIDLLKEAQIEQNKTTFYEIVPKSCQNYLDYLEWRIEDEGRYSNCDEDTLWAKAQLELIREIKNHII